MRPGGAPPVSVDSYIELVSRELRLPARVAEDRLAELRSHLWEAALANRRRQGCDRPSPEDVRLAVAAFGPPREAARALSVPTDKGMPASFLTRAAAYVLDYVVLASLVGIPLLAAYLLVPWPQLRATTYLGPASILAGAFALANPLLVALSALSEWRFGTTIGKRLLGLSTRRAMGEPLAVKEALIRNITKQPLLLAIDSLVSLLFGWRGQRIADRRMGTLVVTARGGAG